MNKCQPGFLFYVLAIIFFGLPGSLQGAKGSELNMGGHFKLQAKHSQYGESSYYNTVYGDSSTDLFADFRINLNAKPTFLSALGNKHLDSQNMDINIAYQFLALGQEAQDQSGVLFSTNKINDHVRLFNFSKTLSNDTNTSAVHRLDRFNIGYTGEKTVVRLGRQALSWGNSVLLNVMDIVNPFDPTIFDREYKTGDDMLYMQYLLNNGNDLEFAWVLRRDPVSENIAQDRHSFAAKYRGTTRLGEVDILLAEHFGNTLLALGGNQSFGGAIAYGDIALTQGVKDTGINASGGIRYSWVWLEKNFSGVLEMSHNSLGLKKYFAYADLLNSPELLDKVQRGEAIFLGKNHLAMAATLEVSPLVLTSLNIFSNLDDQSVLFQLTGNIDWQENLQLLFALTIPSGKTGSEFSGVALTEASKLNSRYLSQTSQFYFSASYYF